ncbi:ATP-dependent DNA ligase [Glaciihabitans sp. UYNi722]|uniref:DUF7882 family protein n=1 Tax=Glaciihabitans sp. UYNi722 TaxID=3156344 RepID=UPI0033968FB6
MGHLVYGISAEHIDLDDRTLAHIQAVIASKLRRSESFWIEFVHDAGRGGRRDVIWVDDAMPFVFRYGSAAHPKIDRKSLDDLLGQASDRGRMIIRSHPLGQEKHT